MLTLCHILRTSGRAICAALCGIVAAACTIDPPLHLVDPGEYIQTEFQRTEIDLNIIFGYDFTTEWYYGWDDTDNKIFGLWDIQQPDTFNLRRYWKQNDPNTPHSAARPEMFVGRTFRDRYKYGYYDLLVWNKVSTLDGVQALEFDEESTYDYITAYTNQSHTPTKAPQYYSQQRIPAMRVGYAFYEPEFLFSAYQENVHITNNPADYDYFDSTTLHWVKKIPMAPEPVTYIYLPQIIIHNNKGRLAAVDGRANLTGMARSVNLNTHITSEQDVSVMYSTRMKKDVPYHSEQVDIIGGRLFTFGITGTNPYHLNAPPHHHEKGTVPPLAALSVKNYLEVPIIFNNGLDSTFVFDVTDQVLTRYKGGVITIHLDADTIPIPSRSGGSGFNAIVKEFEEETHEFEM